MVAAECCYGAELYDPAVADGHAGICNTYLAEGAYGFFGSSTIAYGPPEGNGQADLICQYFLERVLPGASLGRAALEARQRFVRAGTRCSIRSDLKTLAQFSLLGDPSIHPVGRAPNALGRVAPGDGLSAPRMVARRRERPAANGSCATRWRPRR